MRLLIISLLIFGLTGCSSKQGTQQRKLEVFVPCSVFGAFCEILDQYKKANPGLKVEFDTGNTIVLMRKVLNKGKRPDVYMGTGPFETEPLEKAGLIEPGTKKVFSYDALILTTPLSNPAGINSLDDLLSEKAKSIAIPDNTINSSGHFAVQAFKDLGIWDKIKDKVLFTQYGRESREYIIKGKVDAGIMYFSCLYEDVKPGEDILAQRDIRVVEKAFNSHPVRISSYVCVLKDAANKEEGKKFLQFMLGDFSQKALQRWGGGL